MKTTKRRTIKTPIKTFNLLYGNQPTEKLTNENTQKPVESIKAKNITATNSPSNSSA